MGPYGAEPLHNGLQRLSSVRDFTRFFHTMADLPPPKAAPRPDATPAAEVRRDETPRAASDLHQAAMSGETVNLNGVSISFDRRPQAAGTSVLNEIAPTVTPDKAIGKLAELDRRVSSAMPGRSLDTLG